MFHFIVRSTPRIPLHHLVAAGLVGLLFIGLAPSPLNAARGGGKTEVLPVQKAAPAAVIIEGLGNEAELRRQMRAKNGVAELGASTSQVMFSQAPTGTFGFIVPKLLGLAFGDAESGSRRRSGGARGKRLRDSQACRWEWNVGRIHGRGTDDPGGAEPTPEECSYRALFQSVGKGATYRRGPAGQAGGGPDADPARRKESEWSCLAGYGSTGQLDAGVDPGWAVIRIRVDERGGVAASPPSVSSGPKRRVADE
jgi:hypothetical protein